ncbi:MAG: hypothetical protein UR43_C0014G0022 [candidate division TM6 bacterium GW2011_GWF2_33_332]|nr:MAG: hypothetical protein UR43_C0014G0022 [candidate division TM6 bacterium GW2011_GWF2_33_332]
MNEIKTPPDKKLIEKSEQEQLNQLVKKFPNLKKLIDKFDLELIKIEKS